MSNSNTPIIPDDLANVAEIAKLLGTSSASVRRWVKSGAIPGFHLGGQLRISRADALGFLRRVVPDGDKPHIPTKAEKAARDAETDSVLRSAGIRR